MPQLSRRQFLKFAGIALAGSQLPDLHVWAEPASDHVYGRALYAAPVYSQPESSAPMVRHLWPDNVLPLHDTSGAWYRVEEGYVERSALQPVNQRPSQAAPSQSPFWAEVVAPVAPVWQWCAVDAPLVTRIGHGGAAHVINRLPGWYAVADDQDRLLGWSQALHWTPVQFQPSDTPLEIVVVGDQMTAYRLSQPVASAPVSLGQPIPPGTYALEKGLIGGLCCHLPSEGDYHGASWQLRFGDQFEITSAYWHNRFGQPVVGPSIQVTPVLGRWLYMVAGQHSVLTLRPQAL